MTRRRLDVTFSTSRYNVIPLGAIKDVSLESDYHYSEISLFPLGCIPERNESCAMRENYLEREREREGDKTSRIKKKKKI